MLKEAHTNATHFKANDYRLIDSGLTSGLGTLGSDINAYNEYGMTPVQVALQAGAEDELVQILSHPQCQPLRASSAGFGTYSFISLFKQSHEGEDAKAARMWKTIKDATEKLEAAPAQRREHA